MFYEDNFQPCGKGCVKVWLNAQRRGEGLHDEVFQVVGKAQEEMSCNESIRFSEGGRYVFYRRNICRRLRVCSCGDLVQLYQKKCSLLLEAVRDPAGTRSSCDCV